MKDFEAKVAQEIGKNPTDEQLTTLQEELAQWHDNFKKDKLASYYADNRTKIAKSLANLDAQIKNKKEEIQKREKDFWEETFKRLETIKNETEAKMGQSKSTEDLDTLLEMIKNTRDSERKAAADQGYTQSPDFNKIAEWASEIIKKITQKIDELSVE